MIGINYLVVVVAAAASWVATSAWYILFGKELAKVSPAFAALLGKGPSWRQFVVLAQHLVLAFVLAHLVVLTGIAGWLDGVVRLGIWLWVGLSAVQWVGSILWENVPLKLAAIHAGDWFLKLVVISAIVGAWR